MKKEQKLIFRLLPLLIAAVIAALLPQMIRNEYYMTIACQILIYLIAVCGLNFITGLTGQMNLGTAGMFAMGAYVSGLLNVKLGVSPWLGLVAALCVGWLIGKALGYPSLRLRGVYLSLTTIAFTEIIRMLLNNMKGVTNGAQGLRGIERYNFFGYRVEGTIPYYYWSSSWPFLWYGSPGASSIPSGAASSRPCATTLTPWSPAASTSPR